MLAAGVVHDLNRLVQHPVGQNLQGTRTEEGRGHATHAGTEVAPGDGDTEDNTVLPKEKRSHKKKTQYVLEKSGPYFGKFAHGEPFRGYHNHNSFAPVININTQKSEGEDTEKKKRRRRKRKEKAKEAARLLKRARKMMNQGDLSSASSPE